MALFQIGTRSREETLPSEHEMFLWYTLTFVLGLPSEYTWDGFLAYLMGDHDVETVETGWR